MKNFPATLNIEGGIKCCTITIVLLARLKNLPSPPLYTVLGGSPKPTELIGGSTEGTGGGEERTAQLHQWDSLNWPRLVQLLVGRGPM